MSAPVFSGRTLVSFLSGGSSFHVFVPKDGYPAEIATALNNAARGQPSFKTSVGLYAADFIKTVDPIVRCELVIPCEYVKANRWDLEISVVVGGSLTDLYSAYSGRRSTTYFSGSIVGLMDWAEKAGNGLANLNKKVVRFKYSGGTHPNKTRLVRVDEVKKNNDGSWFIGGHDLEKDSLTSAYRHYNGDKIVGEIEVLN